MRGGQAETLAVISPQTQEDYIEGGNWSQALAAVMTHDILRLPHSQTERAVSARARILRTISEQGKRGEGRLTESREPHSFILTELCVEMLPLD